MREAFLVPPETYYVRKKIGKRLLYTPVKRERKRKIDKVPLAKSVKENSDAYLKEFGMRFDRTAAAIFYALKKNEYNPKKNNIPITKNPKSYGKNIGSE